jgi:hypothetical protein
MWDSPVLIALLNTAGAVILAYFTYKTQREVKKNSSKLDTTAVQVDEVHKQTNGNMDRLQAALETMTNENKRLTNLLISKEQKDAQG